MQLSSILSNFSQVLVGFKQVMQDKAHESLDLLEGGRNSTQELCPVRRRRKLPSFARVHAILFESISF